MPATLTTAKWLVLGLRLAAAEVSPQPQPQQLADLPAIPPSRGRWILHGMDCLMVRRRDGRLGCYIRIPHTHELYGRTDLDELSFALEYAHGITYAAPGAHGWFIGTVIEGSWEDAWDLLDDLAQQLVAFSASEAEAEPPLLGNRVSGVHSVLPGSNSESVSAESA